MKIKATFLSIKIYLNSRWTICNTLIASSTQWLTLLTFMMPQLNLNNSCILLKLNSMIAFFTKVNLLVLLFSFTMILMTKISHLRASEYLMRLANWTIPHLLLSCFQISNADFLPRWWMADLLIIALRLYSM